MTSGRGAHEKLIILASDLSKSSGEQGRTPADAQNAPIAIAKSTLADHAWHRYYREYGNVRAIVLSKLPKA